MIQTLFWDGEPQVEVEIRDGNEHIQRHWLTRSFYEGHENGLLRYIADTFLQGGVYVDVGASIGNHTLFFAKVMRADRVIAIEPYGPSFEHLTANLLLNPVVGDATVSCRRFAASDSERMVAMESYHESNNVGMRRVTKGNDVLARPLDDILQDEPHIDIIKIDVENHNWQLLHGAKKTLIEHEPVVYIEAGNEKELDDVDLLLGRFGYVRTLNLCLNYTSTYEYCKE